MKIQFILHFFFGFLFRLLFFTLAAGTQKSLFSAPKSMQRFCMLSLRAMLLSTFAYTHTQTYRDALTDTGYGGVGGTEIA